MRKSPDTRSLHEFQAAPHARGFATACLNFNNSLSDHAVVDIGRIEGVLAALRSAFHQVAPVIVAKAASGRRSAAKLAGSAWHATAATGECGGSNGVAGGAPIWIDTVSRAWSARAWSIQRKGRDQRGARVEPRRGSALQTLRPTVTSGRRPPSVAKLRSAIDILGPAAGPRHGDLECLTAPRVPVSRP
jgi:hypothetical protein